MPAFATRYAQAKAEAAETWADAIMDIADDPNIPSDHKRIMVDARKWIACKLRPTVYGDRVTHDGSVNITVTSGVPGVGDDLA
jgi:hypothetical protein